MLGHGQAVYYRFWLEVRDFLVQSFPAMQMTCPDSWINIIFNNLLWIAIINWNYYTMLFSIPATTDACAEKIPTNWSDNAGEGVDRRRLQVCHSFWGASVKNAFLLLLYSLLFGEPAPSVYNADLLCRPARPKIKSFWPHCTRTENWYMLEIWRFATNCSVD